MYKRQSLYYTIYEDAVLTRFVSIKNESEDIVKIHRLLSMSLDPVSYTHLDVYKRQAYKIGSGCEGGTEKSNSSGRDSCSGR